MAGILVCDDAAFMRMMIKDILGKNGYTVAGEAENGHKAVEKYTELKPDLVLMDITMPEMDGIQALKEIREEQKKAEVQAKEKPEPQKSPQHKAPKKKKGKQKAR